MLIFLFFESKPFGYNIPNEKNMEKESKTMHNISKKKCEIINKSKFWYKKN